MLQPGYQVMNWVGVMMVRMKMMTIMIVIMRMMMMTSWEEAWCEAGMCISRPYCW